MPVVVGVPRSGTTLLRLMLDAHPDLAIPPETGFLAELAGADPPSDARSFVDRISSYPPGMPGWADFGLDAGALLTTLEERSPFDLAEAVREFYRAYAARHGKPRWGDKTPGYARSIGPIGELLPEARFVHVVRDPRDVVVSWRRQWFAPSREVAELGREWRRTVAAVRNARERGAKVVEVRYEDLVAEPAPTLGRVCAHVDLPPDAAMLSHETRAASRLAEHLERRRADGTLFLSREARLAQQASSRRARDPGLSGTWRASLTPAEARAVEGATLPLLAELGYEAG